MTRNDAPVQATISQDMKAIISNLGVESPANCHVRTTERKPFFPRSYRVAKDHQLTAPLVSSLWRFTPFLVRTCGLHLSGESHLSQVSQKTIGADDWS
jgi:hypothetical protein